MPDRVLSVCVEVCTAAFFLEDDPGVLISACLFGDGAGAAVLAGQAHNRRRVEWKSSGSLLEPEDRDLLRFELKQGMLRNVLSPLVPARAAEQAAKLFEQVLARAAVPRAEIKGWVLHPGGRDVLAALRDRLGLSEADLRHSSAVLKEYGNLSSASLFFVLEAALADSPASGYWWMSSFGAGFSCHGAFLEVNERDVNMTRAVKAELLDELPPEAPEARQSRRDLHRINAWMGNAGTVARVLRVIFPGPPARVGQPGRGRRPIHGARGPTIAARLARDAPAVARPPSHPLGAGRRNICWPRLSRLATAQADVFEWLRRPTEEVWDVFIANLFLHHFSEAQLAELFRAVARRALVLVAVEPRRAVWPLAFSRLVGLIGCNRVTRHDAPVSVRAGFAGPANSPGSGRRRQAGC